MLDGIPNRTSTAAAPAASAVPSSLPPRPGTRTTTKLKYALVPHSSPIELPPDCNVDDASKIHSSQQPSRKIQSSSHLLRLEEGTEDVVLLRDELLSIYEMYAALYPNPDLSLENQERDRLLRAAQAADHAVQLNPPKKKQKAGGWLGGLFQSRRDKEDASAKKRENDFDDDDDHRLKYTEPIVVNHGTGYSPQPLLGTEDSLDTTHIPTDAHAVARFHLLLHHHARQPNLARTAWERAGTRGIVLTDLGTVVEFSPTSSSELQLQHTFDRSLLQQYLVEQQQQSSNESLSSALSYHIAQARAVLVGPNLLIVSWGLPNDDRVVFYRRLMVSSESTTTSAPSIVWDAVACLGPTTEVQDNLGDVFLQDEQGHNASAALLLAVTDVVPLVVEIPNQAPCLSLAVARLGGSLELVPLPNRMWYGPALAHPNKRNRKLKRGEHFAAQLPNLAQVGSTSSRIVALTTSEYHVDILGLASFRTTVSDSVEWNAQLYPHGPPAEHVLVAHGRTPGSGETVTFWSVSTVIVDTSGDQFSLHAHLVEALDLGPVGPGVSLFASPNLMRHWRRPRHVELRREDDEEEDPLSASRARVTTLSVGAPIVNIQFLVDYGNHNDAMVPSSPTIRAALQDWNGGVTILDCDLLEKVVSQTLSPEEYDLVHNSSSSNPPEGDNMSEHDVAAPLVKIIQDRSSSIRQLVGSGGKKRSWTRATKLRLQSLQWFEGKGPVSSKGSCLNYALAALTGNDPCSLRLVFPSAVYPKTGIHSTNESDASAACESTTVACSNYSTGALHRFAGGRKHNLYLALLSSSASSANGKRQLSIFCLQELGPKDIVRHLVESNQLREALLESQHVPAAEYESISKALEKCKKHLWEVERDFSSLEAVKDDAYIVEQALYAPLHDAEQAPRIDIMDVGLFRAVCRLALNRMQTARLGSSLVFAGSVEKARQVRQDIETRLIKIGTYELLCRYLSCEPSLNQFLEQYLPVAAIDLATSFAESADIVPLTLLFFRHRQDLMRHECRILDQIPLSVPPFLYQHLLPIKDETCNLGIHTGLFMAGPNPELLLDISCLPTYLEEQFGFPAVIDEDDNKLASELTAKLISDINSDSGRPDETLALPEWFARRADLIDKFLYSLESAGYFSDLALIALRFERDAVAPETLSPPLSKLYHLATFANALSCVIPDQSDADLLATLTRLGSDGFATIAVEKLVESVMNCGGEPVNLKSRYDHILLPLLRARLSCVDAFFLFQEVDQALVSFCVSLLDDPTTLLSAVNLCSNIIIGSRTSLERSSRLIKERNTMIHFALSIFRKVTEAMTISMTSEIADELELMDALWRIYESLPVAMPQIGDKDNIQIDLMFDHLVFVDILVRWPLSGAFSLLQERISILSENEDRTSAKHIRIGNTAVSALCQSLCGQLQDLHGQPQQHSNAEELLVALLNDVTQLNELCFEHCLSLRKVFADRLFRPLLVQHEIPLLEAFLARASREDIDMDCIAKEVSIFFNDAVHGSRLHGDLASSRLGAAIQCQDLLEKYLPEFRNEFRAVRMYLDAAHHINSTLLPDSDINFGPEELRHMLPLDVVEVVLAANPHALVIDCTEWLDHDWAKHANETIRNHIRISTSQTPDHALTIDSVNLPPLPGHSVFYLTKLLGMENQASVIAVKARAIEYALHVGLTGAASALCRSLVADVMASGGDTSPALYSVAKIAIQDNYDDIETKKELFSLILVKCTENLTPARTIALENILSAWNIIEHHDRHPLKGPLVSTRLLFHDVQSEYSIDLQLLFATLYHQLAECKVDEALLQSLARYVTFWCIGRTTRPKRNPVGPLEPPSTASMIALAASLVLHIRNNEFSEPCLGELGQIFNEQIVHVANLSPMCEDFTSPNPSIVRKLMGRGYSEFGSRRAAMMTNNTGFDLALQWAVLHSTDHDFDASPLCIRSPEERFVDKRSKDMLGVCITALQKILSGELPLRITTFEKDWDLFSPASSENVIARTAQSQPHGTEYDREGSTIYSVHQEIDGTSTGQTPGKSGKLKALAPHDKSKLAHAQKLPGAQAHAFASTEKEAVPLTNTTLPLPTSPSQIKTAVLESSDAPCTNGLSSQTPPQVDAQTTRATRNIIPPPKPRLLVITKSPPVGSPDRSSLLELGQAVFQSARNASPSRVEERRRLMEQGRLLLQKARSAGNRVPPTKVPTATPPTSTPQSPPAHPADTPVPVINDKSDDADQWDFEDDFDI